MQPESPATDLTAVFARIRGMLLSLEDAAAAVHQLAEVAKELIPSAAGAGASLIDDGGTRRSTGATDAVVESADALQYELGEGPCLSAWATMSPQRVDDTSVEDRWSDWAAAAERSGIRSALSAPMVHRDHAIGALKVYATTARAFSAHEERLLGLLAGAAATLLGSAQTREAPQRLSDELQRGLDDRQMIDRATGMLMEQRGTDPQDAHCVLLTASRNQNRSMAEVAQQVLERRPDLEA